MDLFRKKDITTATKTSKQLRQCLTVFDLTFLGVGAIIGAGIFILTGIVAANQAGPAIVISYVIAGFACGFAALSYAELAAAIGGCGSAYGYAYAGFGELFAWIVGWDLLLEYSISVSTVSVGWSGYANDFLAAIGIHIPQPFLQSPMGGGFFNALSAGIILFLAALLTCGVKSSSRFNNVMVLIKISVILLFIGIACFNIQPANWSSFLPFGWSGVIKGAALIFFAYIGFDAVSTAAEEAINPQRDLPRSIIGSLLICTFLYVIVAGLLTAITHYTNLNVSSPISRTLLNLGYRVAASLVGVGALAGLTTVMLVLFYGLTRIFLAMSHDGLLPRLFSRVSKRTKTPARIIALVGLIMAVISALIPMRDLAELVNIGTLFAFIMVCSGVLVLRRTKPDMPRPYKTPGMPYVPVLGIVSCLGLMMNLPWVSIMRFVVWMVLGLIIYFSFGRQHSMLNTRAKAPLANIT